MAGIKSNRAEFERRVLSVAQWIIDGATSMTIINNILEKGWCKSRRQAEVYIHRGFESFKKNLLTSERNELKNVAIERHLSDRNAALAANNSREARMAQIEINKLLGLYEPIPVEYTQITVGLPARLLPPKEGEGEG
jgi:hypothetical protein